MGENIQAAAYNGARTVLTQNVTGKYTNIGL